MKSILGVTLYLTLSIGSTLEAQTPALSPEALREFMIQRRSPPSAEAIPAARNILASPIAEGPEARASSLLRAEALATLKENSLLDEYIADLERRSHEHPGDQQITLALAEAFSVLDPDKATPYYEKAGLIAPVNVELNLKLASGLAGNGQDEGAMELYDQLLAQHLDRALHDAEGDLVPLYLRRNALGRLTRQIAHGFNAPVMVLRTSAMTLYKAGELADRLIKLGDEDDAITLLQAVKPTPDLPRSAQINEQVRQDLELIDLLIKHHRNAEALRTIIALFAPRPYDPSAYGLGRPWEFATELITWKTDSSSLPSCPAIALVGKAKMLGGLPQLMTAVEADLEKHPDEISEQTIYAVGAVWGRVEKAKPFLFRYLERITNLPPEHAFRLTMRGFVTEPDSTAPQSAKTPFVSHDLLLAMAEQLRPWPAGRSLVFPTLIAAQAEFLRNRAEPNRFLGLWPEIAAAALKMNDLPKAQEVLRKVLGIVEADSRRARLRSAELLLPFFEMMLRARMKAEAAAVLRMIMDPNRSDAAFIGTREAALLRRAARIALEAGTVDLANSAASALPKTLEAGINDEYLQPDDLISSLQLLLQLHRNTDAKSLVECFQDAKEGDKNFTAALTQSERMLRIFAGEERDLTPAIFLGATPPARGQNIVHWDLTAATMHPSGTRESVIVSTMEAVPPAFTHLRRLTILAGETETRLKRVTEIQTLQPRGRVRLMLPKNTHFGRILVTDDDGNEIVGTPIPLNPIPNLIVNSAFEGLPAISNLDHGARAITGWKGLPEGDWSFTASGPFARAIRYHPEQAKEVLLSGQRIPVSPNDEFFQSGWIRKRPREGAVRIGRRFLNRDGVELEVSYCPETATGGPWLLVQQELRLTSNGPNERIPGGCAFIEPVIQVTTPDSFPNSLGQMAVWSGLYLGKVVGPPGKKPIDPNQTIFFSEKESPTQISVSADSRFIAAGYPNGLIRVLDRKGKVIATVPENFQTTVAMHFLRDAPQLISFGGGGEIRRLMLQPAFLGKINASTRGTILNADITPDGAYAVIFTRGKTEQSNGGPGEFEVLDLNTGETVRTIDSDWPGVYNLTVSEDGSRFYALGNARLYPWGLWLLSSGNRIGFSAEEISAGIDYLKLLGLKHPVSIDVFLSGQNAQAICADPQRNRSIIARDGKIFVYDLILRKDIWGFHNAGEVRRLTVIPDTGAILSIGGDSAIRQWTVPSSATRK